MASHGELKEKPCVCPNDEIDLRSLDRKGQLKRIYFKVIQSAK